MRKVKSVSSGSGGAALPGCIFILQLYSLAMCYSDHFGINAKMCIKIHLCGNFFDLRLLNKSLKKQADVIG